jgi:UDP-3-O-[3-hydroxymyristoyl] N-acetylglucosamine deacetylase
MGRATPSSWMRPQNTLRTPVAIEGIALHSGHMVRVTFRPACEDHGIVLRRTDFPEVAIPAVSGSALGFDHATTLGAGGARVATVEHALSAAYALGLDNLDVEVDGDELPILDGSALPFLRLFQAAGLARQKRQVEPLVVSRPVDVSSGDKHISAHPGRGLTIVYEIDFPHPAIGRQRLTYTLRPETYFAQIAAARTFGFTREIEYLRARGLALGGSLQNAVVLDEKTVLSGPLRFRDEFVRHKVLDLLGDLALLGRPVEGVIRARKAGHALHAELVHALLSPHRAGASHTALAHTATASA